MSYLEELLPEFRKGAKIRIKDWDNSRYIYFCNGIIFSADNIIVCFPCEYINSDKWEFYQEPIDWDSIIKNKCLCWFWDKREDYKMMGTLEKYASLSNISRFIANVYGEENGFCNCRPVRRDEVTFYEDRKDE